MPLANLRTYRARWVFPIASPPMDDGRVTLSGSQVISVSRDRVAGEIDLGDVALLPGWCNAHTHLEFNGLHTPLGNPRMALPEWIGCVLAYRREHETHNGNDDPPSPFVQGLQELAKTQTALAADIAQPSGPHDFARETLCRWLTRSGTESEQLDRAGTCVTCEPNSLSPFYLPFHEVLGLQTERALQRLQHARVCLASSPSYVIQGISPHAPYSTLPTTVKACVALACEFGAPIAMHLAESLDEERLTLEGQGGFVDAFERAGLDVHGIFPNHLSTLDWLRLLAPAPRVLVVHGNYLSDDAIAYLARLPHYTVVYCPRTHAYFGHTRHPVDRLLQAGVRVAIGTDSRASNPDLDMSREVTHLLLHRPDLSPRDIFAMATLHAADAVDCSRLGRIANGCTPGLQTIPLSDPTISDPWESLADALLHVNQSQANRSFRTRPSSVGPINRLSNP